jgi:hypothetical protein
MGIMYLYGRGGSVILSKLFRSNIKNAGLGDKKLPFGIIIEICYLRGQVQFWTTHKPVNVWGIGFIGMKAGVVEIQCLIMLVKFTKCILIKLAFY